MSSLFCLPTVIFAIALPFCCLRTVLTPLVRSTRSCPWQHPPAGTSSFAFVDPLRPGPGRGCAGGEPVLPWRGGRRKGGGGCCGGAGRRAGPLAGCARGARGGAGRGGG